MDEPATTASSLLHDDRKPLGRDRAPASPDLSPIISHATLTELTGTNTVIPPTNPIVSAFLLPHQYLVFVFPVTLVLGSLFGFIGGNRPSYFSNKRNILNVLFVKNGWGWTSLVFLIYVAVVFGKAFFTQQERQGTTASQQVNHTRTMNIQKPQEQGTLESSTTNGDSTATASTSETGVRTRTRSSPQQHDEHLQSMVGTNMPAPGTNASARVPSDVIIKALVRWGLASLYWWLISQWFFGPGLFDRVFVLTGGSCSVDGHWSQYHCRNQGGLWSGGVDISGHMFLLTHAWLFLMEELSMFLNVPEAWTALQNRSGARYAVWSVVALCGLWWWMLLMTSVYYHHMAEKLTGLFFGVLFWFCTYVTTYKMSSFPSMPDQAAVL
ncbi:hypothetical protein BG011_001648 [Mortierella polycephala]|uniref:Inositol phospholipid synthesis and fat-storage-inducing TM-domain-containing protein n=1 Tax=Mortierella polycephala TaxID=41804 RepID=A0A9P6U634_9FUNG|nr:hypothetical protein BG011_001648 [Mortierella polycephala]